MDFIEKINDEFDVINHKMSEFMSQLYSEVDIRLKVLLELQGIDANDIEFLQKNISAFSTEGDEFTHYVYRAFTSEEKRIM